MTLHDAGRRPHSHSTCLNRAGYPGEPAVRMVLDTQDEHGSRWAAITSIAGRLGCAAQLVRSKTGDRMKYMLGVMVCASLVGPFAGAQDNSDVLIVDDRKGHSNDQLPFKLVVHAGMAAAKVTANPRFQFAFVSAYANGVVEGLVFGSDNSLQAHCDRITDEQGKAIACGSALGTEVGATKQFNVSLEDFGFLKQDVRGIFRLDEAHIPSVKVAGRTALELRPTPATKDLRPGKCYLLRGFLSNEGVFGSREAPYTREFIAISAESLKKGC